MPTRRARKLDQAGAREFALSLPEAHEGSHMGRADLRVANKIFATLADGGKCLNIKSTSPNVDALVHSDPKAFRDCWAGTWVAVDLARVTGDQVRELLTDAWRLTAPKRVVDQQGTELRGGDGESQTPQTGAHASRRTPAKGGRVHSEATK